MTRFILVRHGVCAQTDSVLLGRALDAPLDERGRRQVEELALRFDAAFDLQIEASPRRRTQQTAAAIAEPVGASVRSEPALDEVDFGRWSGASFAELEHDAEWRLWNERRGSASTPAGDTMAAVQNRVVGRLHALHERRPGGAFALVTHAEVIRAALMHALDAPLDEYWRYEIAPATCTTLSFDGARFTVHAVNGSSAAVPRESLPQAPAASPFETAR